MIYDKLEENIRKIIAYSKYLNMNINLDSPGHRFRLQKLAFLLKSMGIDLDYEFTLYLYGVYSNSLYNDSFHYKKEFIEMDSDYKINEKERMILDRLKENFPDNNNILEAATTIIFYNFVYSDINEIIKKIKEIKPHLSDNDIISGINLAKKLLFKKEYLTDEIKQELEAWDSFD
jgi:uncharacterized protein YwgA